MRAVSTPDPLQEQLRLTRQIQAQVAAVTTAAKSQAKKYADDLDLVTDPVDGALAALATRIDALDGAVNAIVGLIGKMSGWAVYNDASGDISVPSATWTPITISGGSSITDYLPTDIAAMWASDKMTGREGDMRIAMIEMSCTATSGSTSYIDSRIDIGGMVGTIYPDREPLTRGVGNPQDVRLTMPFYTLDTWAANGGVLEVYADGPVTISARRILIGTLYSAAVKAFLAAWSDLGS